MEPSQDWRSPLFEEELSRLDRGGVSFEFLRRNKQYRQDYAEALARIATGGSEKAEAIARLARRWGCPFPADPSVSASTARPLWHARHFPATLIVTAAPHDFVASSYPDPRALPVRAEPAADGFHAIIADREGDHRLWLPQGKEVMEWMPPPDGIECARVMFATTSQRGGGIHERG